MVTKRGDGQEQGEGRPNTIENVAYSLQPKEVGIQRVERCTRAMKLC
jgi:hypothetical protein